MARRYSRYRKYSRRYRSRGTGRSRAISNMKSAYQQKDNASVVLNVQRNIACKKNGLDSPWNAGERDVAVLNIYDCLAHSEFFTNYAPMYDQFKIDRVRVKLTCLGYPAFAGNTSSEVAAGSFRTTSYTIVTAWDRNGLDENQVVFGSVTGSGTSESPYTFKISNKIADNIATYSSAVTKSLSAGSAFSQTRYINCSSMQEKEQFVSTDPLKS